MKSRADSLQALEDQSFDILVVGGGATGAGVGFDAQTRGLSTALIEADDFAAHTSQASTKLIHGGVRYLEQAARSLDHGQYQMVRKALHERKAMLANAPYLTRPLELAVPCRSWFELAYFMAGLSAYDLLAGKDRLFPSRALTREPAKARLPALRASAFSGAVTYADGQFDDARFAIALVQSLARADGEVANRTRLVAFDKDAGGRITGALVEDRLEQRQFHVKARLVVNCTGVFADRLRLLANPSLPPRLRTSKGVHILLPLDRWNSDAALLIPRTVDGRVLFAIPWFGSLLVGTTEDEVGIDADLAVLPSEVRYLLGQLNSYLETPYREDEIKAAFAGLRPLVAAGSGAATKALIRDHEVEVDAKSGLISVLGGKWTTYRAMAEDAVDRAVTALGKPGLSCRTRSLLLAGSHGWTPLLPAELERDFALSSATAAHLARKYGGDARSVAALTRTDAGLAAPLAEGIPAIAAEIVHAARQEMAESIADVLERRIGLQVHDWKAAQVAAPLVGRLLGAERGWNEERVGREVAAYQDGIDRMRAILENRP